VDVALQQLPIVFIKMYQEAQSWLGQDTCASKLLFERCCYLFILTFTDVLTSKKVLQMIKRKIYFHEWMLGFMWLLPRP